MFQKRTACFISNLGKRVRPFLASLPLIDIFSSRVSSRMGRFLLSEEDEALIVLLVDYIFNLGI